MEINKSSRHQKIIGDFGEHLVCDLLSRSGFEVALVDHTGLEIIAYRTSANRRYGITVKSRTRNLGKENDKVNIFSYRKGKNDRQKLLAACKAFACEPWIAVYVETSDSADVYLTSLQNYDKKYRGREGKAIDGWRMRQNYKEQYNKDPNVKHVRIEFCPTNWWKKLASELK